MAKGIESNKTKLARRVIEVFEYFDQNQGKATVMDIVRHYGRPQSSTSELLANLVDMGLLYKDPHSRSYYPTPRLAALGTSAQPQYIRSGRLFAFMDRLAQASGCAIGLYGMVGTRVQLFRWAHTGQTWAADIGCGSSELLSGSAAGLLLLSTLGGEQANRMLWRLNAEAPADARFNHSELRDRVAQFQLQGHARGEAGFIRDCQIMARLLPVGPDERPLALGAVYPADVQLDSERLLAVLKDGIAECLSSDSVAAAPAAEVIRLRA